MKSTGLSCKEKGLEADSASSKTKMHSITVSLNFTLIPIILCISLCYLSYQKYWCKVSVKRPPGPTGWPVFGNALDLFESKGFYVDILRQWAETYGPIVFFKIGSQRHVIISDYKIARELFVKRGSNYADRHTPHALAWATMGQNPALRPKDEGWRRERRFIHKIMSSSANHQYEPVLQEEAYRSLQVLVEHPESVNDELKRFTYSILTKILMGFPVDSPSDRFIVEDEKFRRKFVATFSLDAFPTNLFESLQNLPSYLVPKFHTLENLRLKYLSYTKALMDTVQEGQRHGKSGGVYSQFLSSPAEYNLTQDELIFTLQSIIGAGANSPCGALLMALSLLMRYPEKQARLHQEIDRVVGRNRPPNFIDFPNLSFLRAVNKESIRYYAGMKEAGLPRKVLADDHFDGYIFERGTVFHMNFYAILFDEEMYPDPFGFRPERYLDPSYPTFKGPLNIYPNCQDFDAFGYGRRGCPGSDFSERTCLIMLSQIMWKFRVEYPLDNQGMGDPDIMNWEFSLKLRGSLGPG